MKEESKRPSNGETDGKDDDIYEKALDTNRKARATGYVEMAAFSHGVVGRLYELTGGAKEIVGLLLVSSLDEKTLDTADRLADALFQTTRDAAKRIGLFTPVLQDAAPRQAPARIHRTL